MKWRVFELEEKGDGPHLRYRLHNPVSKSGRSWDRVDFEQARFATPEEAAESIQKDAAYPSNCIIVACVD